MRRKIFKEDILKAGEKLMFLHGYNATGIKQITDEVGIPKGSFYHHFENKEAFGIELLKYYWLNGNKYFTKKLVDSNLSPMNRLKDFFSEMIDYYETDAKSKLGCMLGNFSAEMADINYNFQSILDDILKENEAFIIQCLKEAQEQGEIDNDKDVNLLGEFVISSWHGALLRMKSAGNIKPLRNFESAIFNNTI